MAHSVEKLACDVVLIGDIFKNKDGFYVYKIGIHMSDERILHEFNARIGQSIGIENWSPLSKEEYETGNSLVPLVKNIEDFKYRGWMDVVFAYGRKNDRRKMYGDTPDTVYAICYWFLTPARLAQFEAMQEAVSTANVLLCDMGGRRDKQQHYFGKIGVRAASSADFDLFMNEMGNGIGLVRLETLTQEVFDVYSRIEAKNVHEFVAHSMPYAVENEERLKKAKSDL